MTLHDIENALPPYIRFAYDMGNKAGVIVRGTYMGMIYDTDEGLFYNSQCYSNNPDDCIRKDTFLCYFSYELLLSIQYFEITNAYQLYKLEPKYRVVYK